MTKRLRIFSVALACLLIAVFASSAMTGSAAVISGKTGIGMAEWALRAYNEGWKYVYGGSSEGAIDCSGLIRSYCNKQGGGARALLDAATVKGTIDTLPNVHGLGLWCDGHAGVYVGKDEDGNDMVVDARNSRVNVVYSELNNRYWSPWVMWFKISMISYPDTGWFEFNGDTYYYENGEFVVGIHTVDGVTYDFGKSGALKGVATTSSSTTTTTVKTTTTTTTKKTTTTTTTTTKTTTATTTSTTTTASATTEKTTQSTTEASTTTTQQYNVLYPGTTSDEVKQLQLRLIELGYLGQSSASGYYGTQTQAAVELFQKTAGLDVDGIAGRQTQTLLFSDAAPVCTITTASPTITTTSTKETTTTTHPTESTQSETQQSQSESESTSMTSESQTTAETSPTQPEYMSLYVALQVGSMGEEVKLLQTRLTELGLYSQPVSTYYGSFARDAVIKFQLGAGIEPTGIADPYTQYLIFGGIIEAVELEQDDIQYGEEYYQLGQDLYDVLGVTGTGGELELSEGISQFDTKADVSLYISRYGGGDFLSTLTDVPSSRQTLTMFVNGNSIEITERIEQALEDCIFN